MIPAGWGLKQARRYMAAESARFGEKFEALPTDGRAPKDLIRAMRNRHFMVQVYQPGSKALDMVCRLSVIRCQLDDRGGWLGGITWDQLQAVKAGVGYGDYDAIELYPRDEDVVNVANIRHLWILREPLPWAWGRDGSVREATKPTEPPSFGGGELTEEEWREAEREAGHVRRNKAACEVGGDPAKCWRQPCADTGRCEAVTHGVNPSAEGES